MGAAKSSIVVGATLPLFAAAADRALVAPVLHRAVAGGAPPPKPAVRRGTGGPSGTDVEGSSPVACVPHPNSAGVVLLHNPERQGKVGGACPTAGKRQS